MIQKTNPFLRQVGNAPKKLHKRDLAKIQQVFDDLVAKFKEQSMEELVELMNVNSKLSSKQGRMSSTGLAALEFVISTKDKIAKIEALKQENEEQKEMVRILKEHADKNQTEEVNQTIEEI